MTDSDVSARLFEALSVLPGGPVVAPVDVGARAHRALRRRQGAVVLLAAVTALVAAVPFAVRDSSGAVPSGPAARARVSAEALSHGRWTALPSAPVVPRDQLCTVWTGTQMLVWGGETSTSKGSTTYADGAAYTPGTRTWSVLPPSPLRARSAATTVWTGTEMIVWGGYDGDRQPLADGAAYKPATHTWRMLPPSPLPPSAQAVGVLVGGRVVVLGGTTSTTGQLAGTAAYDPDADSWRPLPDLPRPRDGSYEQLEAAASRSGVLVEAGWTSSHSLGGNTFLGRAGVDSYQLDVVKGTWTLQPKQDQSPLGVRTLLWTGSSNVAAATQALVGGVGGGIPQGLFGRRYDPATGTWSAMSHGPADDLNGTSLWTGQALLTYDTGTETEGPDGAHHPGEAAAWDPSTDQWFRLPSAPAFGATASVWTGTELLEWGALNETSAVPPQPATSRGSSSPTITRSAVQLLSYAIDPATTPPLSATTPTFN